MKLSIEIMVAPGAAPTTKVNESGAIIRLSKDDFEQVKSNLQAFVDAGLKKAKGAIGPSVASPGGNLDAPKKTKPKPKGPAFPMRKKDDEQSLLPLMREDRRSGNQPSSVAQ